MTSLEPALLLEALSFSVDFHRDESVLEFFAVRRILEPAAAGRATHHMSGADAAGLLTLIDEVGDHPGIEALVANDMEFHRRIARGSGNAVLCSLLEGLSGPTQRAAGIAARGRGAIVEPGAVFCLVS